MIPFPAHILNHGMSSGQNRNNGSNERPCRSLIIRSPDYYGEYAARKIFGYYGEYLVLSVPKIVQIPPEIVRRIVRVGSDMTRVLTQTQSTRMAL